MSLQEQQNFLAKLYTDAEFRLAFWSAPEKIGTENNLKKSEIEEIAGIMREELDFFADSLFWKRLREVEKFLPLSKKILGDDFTKYFREFSQNFNPQTIKKHFEDALEFCRFLQKQNVSEYAKNAAKFEESKALFFGLEKRFVICKLDFDIREIFLSKAEIQIGNPKNKTKIAIWIKIGKRFKHFFI